MFWFYTLLIFCWNVYFVVLCCSFDCYVHIHLEPPISVFAENQNKGHHIWRVHLPRLLQQPRGQGHVCRRQGQVRGLPGRCKEVLSLDQWDYSGHVLPARTGTNRYCNVAEYVNVVFKIQLVNWDTYKNRCECCKRKLKQASVKVANSLRLKSFENNVTTCITQLLASEVP